MVSSPVCVYEQPASSVFLMLHLTYIYLFTGRFTKIPANITAKVGQNIEMECAFQSETASVYLEIQWWFIRAPEEPSEIEEETATEVLSNSLRVAYLA